MNLRRYIIWVSLLLSLMLVPLVRGEAAAAGVGEVAPVAAGTGKAAAPDLHEHLVAAVLGKLSVRSGDNTAAHYGIAALFLIGAVLLRRVALHKLWRRRCDDSMSSQRAFKPRCAV